MEASSSAGPSTPNTDFNRVIEVAIFYMDQALVSLPVSCGSISTLDVFNMLCND